MEIWYFHNKSCLKFRTNKSCENNGVGNLQGVSYEEHLEVIVRDLLL